MRISHYVPLALIALVPVVGCGESGDGRVSSGQQRPVASSPTANRSTTAVADVRKRLSSSPCAGASAQHGASVCIEGSDPQQAIAAAERYIGAVATGMWSEACALLNPATRQRLVASSRVLAQTYRAEGRVLTCTQLLKFSGSKFLGFTKPTTPTLTFQRLSASEASVRTPTESRSAGMFLVKIGSQWLVGAPAREVPPPVEAPPTETRGAEAVSGTTLEAQLRAGRIRAATIEPEQTPPAVLASLRTRGLVFATIGYGEEGRWRTMFEAKGVRVTVLTKALAQRRAAGRFATSELTAVCTEAGDELRVIGTRLAAQPISIEAALEDAAREAEAVDARTIERVRRLPPSTHTRQALAALARGPASLRLFTSVLRRSPGGFPSYLRQGLPSVLDLKAGWDYSAPATP